MPRGPLPSPDARRRNPRSIAGRRLPAAGRQEPTPDVPKWVELGPNGMAWWEWAWHTPQATAWSVGDVPFVARRASLEDDLAATADIVGLDFDELFSTTSLAEVDRVVRRVASLATGRVALHKEMRELDNRLGLNPKALLDLRWSIDEDAPPAAPPEEGDDDLADLYGTT